MNILTALARTLIIASGLMSAAWAQQITVYSSGQLAIKESKQLSAYVPLAVTTVKWSVNGIAGGNVTYGTVSTTGLYRAPDAVPMQNAVTVQATSTADATKFGRVTLTVTTPQVQLWSVTPTKVASGSFTVQLNGANFSTSSVVNFGGVPLATTWLSPTSLRASGVASTAQVGKTATITVTNTGLGGTTSSAVTATVVAASTTAPPTTGSTSGTTTGSTGPTTGTSGTSGANAANPGTGLGKPNLAAARLLEQAAFGPTPAALARVKTIGATAWLNEQLLLPETVIPNPAGMGSSAVQSQYLSRLSQAPDQLRQRMAYALGQIVVISLNKNIYPDEIVPYLQILSRHAFGNYRTLLGEISNSPQMGKYLDLANSNKPSPGAGANENYARELLQLFSIGLTKLNLDGSTQLNSQGQVIAAYDQATVQQVALALTGWTYAGTGNNNWENFSGPLQARDINHDMRQKAFLGCTLPAGQTTTQDLNDTLDCVFKHPNVAPFVATRLIRSLVTSNPSPAYIQRVASVFNNNGSGVRGDLRAVAKAILTDAEARNDSPPSNYGRLKDPITHLVGFARALGGNITPTNGLPWMFSRLGEAPLAPPSVFSFYSPLFRIPNTGLAGPEFQIYTPTEAVLRGNFLWAVLNSPGSDFTLDIAPFVAVAGNTVALIDAVDQALLYGRMPAAMRQSLATAIAAQYDNRGRALTALYLASLSGLYAVQQ